MYNRIVADETQFDWDDANVKHIAGHNVSPEEAEQVVLNDPVDIDYQRADNEERYLVVGVTMKARFLTLLWTERRNAVRVITAFDSSREDEEAYWHQKRTS